MKKKILAMTLAATMVIASAMPAMAAGSNNGGSSNRGGSSKAEYTRDYKGGNGPASLYWLATGWGQTPGAWVNNGNGTWSYGNGAGGVWTGWVVNNNYWYYIGANGQMVTGYQVIDGVGYNFASNGALLRN
ncbi:MAG: hypothetical protein J5947_01080 [Clostridium sp.]|nr:hypothetical protein [Clostridium sp.]